MSSSTNSNNEKRFKRKKTKNKNARHENQTNEVMEISDDEIRQALLQNLSQSLTNDSNPSEEPSSKLNRKPTTSKNTQMNHIIHREQTKQKSGKLKRKKSWELELEEELIKYQEKQEEEGKKIDGVKESRRKEPEVVVFDPHVKRKKKSMQITDQEETTSMMGKGKMKQLSEEVYQFGLSGMSFEDREKYEVQRAIKLGAKAPKREHTNYKDYMEELKAAKQKQKEQDEFDRQMGFRVGKKTKGAKHAGLLRNVGFWKDPTSGRGFRVDGQVGRFKGGVQILSKDDVDKIRRKKRTSTKTSKLKF